MFLNRALPLLKRTKRTSKNIKKRYTTYLKETAPVTTLSNKIRVVSGETTQDEIATVGVWIKSGSVYENDKNNGVSNFLERLAFKGTNKRNQQNLVDEVEKLGASLNAYTSKEQTAYVARCFKKDVPKLVDILSDVIQNPALSNDTIELERSAILKDKLQNEHNFGKVIFDYLHDVAFQGSPLQRTVIGTDESIKNIKRDDLINFLRTHYTGDRIVVAGAGVNHEDLCNVTEKSFSSLSSGSSHTDDTVSSKFTGSQVIIRDDLLPEVHFAVALPAVPWGHPNFLTFLLFRTIIGDWDIDLGSGNNSSSRLAELIATEHLAQSFKTFFTPYQSVGLLGTYLLTDSKHLEDSVYEVMYEYQRIGKKGLASAELSTAKAILRSTILKRLDNSFHVAEDLGRSLLGTGAVQSPAQILRHIDEITENDIHRIQDEHLYDTDPAVVAIGPVANVPDYNTIRGWTYWNRI
eukprot:TRINITY_DN5513_c0_g2_i1.p1 TRINITY_DN5513_c0_g2~~TRINITY_DN5513_c0_g2_i1.p1  ORF type:complete len:464 (+),score=82.80 TRINITY_DN5513_c0_g2_i1:34-1425(+)